MPGEREGGRRTDLVLTLDQEVKEFRSVDYCLTEVGHESNESSIPFIDNLSECCGARRHQNLTHSVVKLGHRVTVHT